MKRAAKAHIVRQKCNNLTGICIITAWIIFFSDIAYSSELENENQ